MVSQLWQLREAYAWGLAAASRGRTLQQLKVHTSAQQQAQTYGKPTKDPLQSSVWASGPHLGPYYVFRNVLLHRNGSLTFFDSPSAASTASDLAKRSEVLPGNITKRPSMLDFEVHVWEAPNPQGHAGCHQFVKVWPAFTFPARIWRLHMHMRLGPSSTWQGVNSLCPS